MRGTLIVRQGLVAAFALAVLLTGARADEEKVPLDKLPRAVRDAVKAKFPGAELVGASKEVEKGETLYEVSFKYKGHNHDATFKADGSIVSVEKEITAKDLPRAVAEALSAKYPGATYKKVEEVTEGGKVTYEALLVTADKKTLEVVLDPSGKVIKEEGKDKKKD
jgi:uncharacterized membrane protein YkoI